MARLGLEHAELWTAPTKAALCGLISRHGASWEHPFLWRSDPLFDLKSVANDAAPSTVARDSYTREAVGVLTTARTVSSK